MDKRLKELRHVLKISQTEFGKRIGLKQSSIAGYETGSQKPLNTVIASICKEFNVNEQWLRTGNGPMFQSQPFEEEYLNAAGLILKNKDTRAMNLIIRYQKLNFVQKEALCNILDTLTEKE
ncbi:MAG: helix-turn-helix domain-containing protein [Faecalimonas umbilicata]|uniref:helix-turn-helix domain-containing protein n=1 Tax=Faecalimonas umbilicata TaxID=1912855 RepID=UPI0039964DF1